MLLKNMKPSCVGLECLIWMWAGKKNEYRYLTHDPHMCAMLIILFQWLMANEKKLYKPFDNLDYILITDVNCD